MLSGRMRDTFQNGGRMTEIATGSTVPRRHLGRYLRDLRNAAGITTKVAARELERSEPTIWRIETGQTSVRSLDVKAMCDLYGATPDITEALMSLAKETKAKGWWQAYGDAVPEWFASGYHPGMLCGSYTILRFPLNAGGIETELAAEERAKNLFSAASCTASFRPGECSRRGFNSFTSRARAVHGRRNSSISRDGIASAPSCRVRYHISTSDSQTCRPGKHAQACLWASSQAR
jgi:transcriptional regulator with XRE-family HTH domain